jgi:hypothetical protein
MQQYKLTELEGMPTEFLEEITDKDFFNQLDGGPPAAKTEQKTAFKPEPPQTPTEAGPLNPIAGSGEGANNSNVNVKEIISGELATDLINRILPVILALNARKFMDLDVNKKQFELTAGEKSTIAPIMDKCLAQLNINFENPFIALGMSFAFIYGSKFIDVANNPEVQKVSAKVVKKAGESHPAIKGQSTRKEGETRGRKKKVL